MLELLLDGDDISACMCRSGCVTCGDECSTGKCYDDYSCPQPDFCCTEMRELIIPISKDTGRRIGQPPLL